MLGGVIIAGKKNNPLNPVQWNLLAIVFVIGFLPISVALVSNAGVSGEESWINSIEPHDQPINLIDDSLWLENGGSNLTSWYSDFAPPLDNDKLDCAYVTNGVCEGYYDDSSQSSPELYKGLNLIHSTYPLNYFESNDFFEVRSSRVDQSHSSPAYNNQYAGKSGSEIFSWYLSSKYNNEIEQGQTLDAIRYWMTSVQAYSCNSWLGDNISFEGEISFHYGSEKLKFSGFEYSKNKRFEYKVLDEVHGDWEDVRDWLFCRIRFYRF